MWINCQRYFYAIDLNHNDCLQRYGSNLVRRSVQDAAGELPVRMLASTYIPEEDRIRDADMAGVKVMTFAPILKYSAYPLAEILNELLEIGRRGMGGEIEIEFAVTLDPELEKSRFFFLQIRPMVTGVDRMEVSICEGDRQRAVCYSSHTLGHGVISDISDIIYVDPETFVGSKTRMIASEIGLLNRRLARESRSYLLVGPGRWGSSDPWLGVPVQWSDISGVGAVIELRGPLLRVDPSQGTHFFQKITSLGIPYLTVTEEDGSGS